MRKYSLLEESKGTWGLTKLSAAYLLKNNKTPLHSKIHKIRSAFTRLADKKPKSGGIIPMPVKKVHHKAHSKLTKLLVNNVFSQDLEDIAKKKPMVARTLLISSIPTTAVGGAAGAIKFPYILGSTEMGGIAGSIVPRYVAKGLNRIL